MVTNIFIKPILKSFVDKKISIMDYPEIKISVPRFEERNGFYTTKQRSELMGKIKGKATKPELVLRKALFRSGLSYRLNVDKLPGKPDIVMRKYKLVIFVDGEFWHGYDWETKKNKIKANREFWISKIERNMQRDHENAIKLNNLGFTVIRFWEKEITKNLPTCMEKIWGHIQPKI